MTKITIQVDITTCLKVSNQDVGHATISRYLGQLTKKIQSHLETNEYSRAGVSSSLTKATFLYKKSSEIIRVINELSLPQQSPSGKLKIVVEQAKLPNIEAFFREHHVPESAISLH